jgi:hypothetical protein
MICAGYFNSMASQRILFRCQTGRTLAKYRLMAAAYHMLVRYDKGMDMPLDKAEKPQEGLIGDRHNLRCDFQRFITISSQPRPRFNLDSSKREGYGSWTHHRRY